MRGRGGLGGIHRMMQMNENVKRLGQQVEEKTLDELKKQIETFSSNLSDFASKHKEDIRKNPEFRKEFYMMCTEMGVDPLASKSIWNKTLNLSEFYYELAIQIISISLNIRDRVGSLIEVSEMKNYLTKVRKIDDISELDIIKAIESVSDLKCGFQIVNLSQNKKAVVTIPLHLSNDTNIIMEIAMENKGFITFHLFKAKNNNYDQESFELLISNLINKGLVWIDSTNSILSIDKENNSKITENYKSCKSFVIYWFPGLMTK